MKERSSAVALPPALPARPWAICLGKADLSAAGRLRQVAGVEVCDGPDQVWLRGPALDERLQRRLAAMPGAQRFCVLPDGQLQPVASRLPKGRLPDGPWTSLPKSWPLDFRPRPCRGGLAGVRRWSLCDPRTPRQHPCC